MIDSNRFLQARNKILGVSRERQGIGTYCEKSVHAILKYYMEFNENFHEIPTNGYVADILKDGNVIEIQTANFNKLRDKLSVFLNDYQVTIVYPIPYIKYLLWIDEKTGEISKKRKSPKLGNPYNSFYELYKIKKFLTHPNLKLKILLINMEEYRLLNGYSENRKKGSSRYDRIPLEIVQEINIDSIEDYMQLVPIDLKENFDANEYSKAAKVDISIARTALNILWDIGIVKRVGKNGNRFIYEVNE